MAGQWDRCQVSNKSVGPWLVTNESVGLWQVCGTVAKSQTSQWDRCQVPNELVGPLPGLVIGWESEIEISGSYFGILGKYFRFECTLREGALLVHPEHTA